MIGEAMGATGIPETDPFNQPIGMIARLFHTHINFYHTAPQVQACGFFIVKNSKQSNPS